MICDGRPPGVCTLLCVGWVLGWMPGQKTKNSKLQQKTGANGVDWLLDVGWAFPDCDIGPHCVYVYVRAPLTTISAHNTNICVCVCP